MQFLTNLDLAKNELQNARIQNLAGHPASPLPGIIYFNTTDSTYYGWYGSAWKDLGKSYSIATQIMDGLMSAFDKAKLDGIAASANNYTHPNHTGEVTSAGDGPTTIVAKAVTNAKMADMLASTMKGRITSTGAPQDLTVTEVKTILSITNVTNVAQIALSLKGAVNGVAELDSGGKVPAAQLPSYVDDVLEFANLAAFPATGETGKIYVAIDTNLTYRWSGTVYVEISASLALGETSATAYRGDRGKIAYDHSQSAHAPSDAQKNSNITLAEIEAKLTGSITSHTHPAAQITESTTKRFVTDVQIAAWNAKTGKYAVTFGDGVATSFVITHNLNTQDITVALRENASPFGIVYADIEITSVNTITLRFAVAPTASKYRVVVIG